jgi:hypothetical protein
MVSKVCTTTIFHRPETKNALASAKILDVSLPRQHSASANPILDGSVPTAEQEYEGIEMNESLIYVVRKNGSEHHRCTCRVIASIR